MANTTHDIDTHTYTYRQGCKLILIKTFTWWNTQGCLHLLFYKFTPKAHTFRENELLKILYQGDTHMHTHTHTHTHTFTQIRIYKSEYSTEHKWIVLNCDRHLHIATSPATTVVTNKKGWVRVKKVPTTQQDRKGHFTSVIDDREIFHQITREIQVNYKGEKVVRVQNFTFNIVICSLAKIK